MRARYDTNERAYRTAEIASLRAALTEAISETINSADINAVIAHETTDATAERMLREKSAALRAKAEAWRKVLAESEVGT